MRTLALAILLAVGTLAAGCGTVTVKHEVEPIFVTVDVNIRIQEQLEDFFDYEQNRSIAAKGGAQ